MQDYKNYKILGLSLLLIAVSVGIPIFASSQISPSENSNQDLICDTGVIVYIPIEFAFFGIISKSGNCYEPINLPDEFKIDGLRVFFIGERLDYFSINMWGIIIKVLFITITGEFFNI